MYPYFEIFGLRIYMVGVGITVSIIVLLFMVYRLSKSYGLNFWRFFNWFPILLILPYVLGSYFHYLINHGLLYPSSLNELFMILSPYGYNLNFIGVSLGIFLFIVIFLRFTHGKADIFKRIDVLFYSISIAIIPLGIFLLFGDNFIGRPTNGIFGVSALTENSALFKFNKVHPIGIYLSVVALISFLVMFFYHYIFKAPGFGFWGFMILLFLLNFVFVFQSYSKHLPLSVSWVVFDIKNYWTIVLIVMIFIYYKIINKN